MSINYPILEHDYTSEAKIEPSRVIKPRDVPEHCIISFFRDMNEMVISQKQVKVVVPNRWEDGEHPIYEIEHRGSRLAIFHPGGAGDDLSGENWDKRGWQSRQEVSESLFWLAADACLEV